MGMSRREFSLLMSSAAAALAAPRALAAPLKVRRGIHTLGATDLDVLRAGISAMKALPTEDFRSWMYQAGVHGSTAAEAAAIPDGATYWRQCKHNSPHFLTWHRWYLLFCEEIMRLLADDCHLTLPYWDYIADNFLPEPLRIPADVTTNSLYDDTRHPDINTGVSGISGLHTDALDVVDFLMFSDDLASNPHNGVHNQITGNMGLVRTAGRDPVFWLHHCNIDRYWECWIRKGGGRVHPGSPWSDEEFPFHSLTGRRDVIVADGLRTADLGYTYDSLPCSLLVVWEIPDWIRDLVFVRVPWRRPPLPDPPPWREILELPPLTLNGQPTAVVVSRAEFLRAGGANARRVAVVLHGVEGLSARENRAFSLDVALAPDAKRIAVNDFRGVAPIDAFGNFELSVLAEHAEHHGASSALVLELPERALKALSAGGDEFALVFFRRGHVDRDGRPRPFDAKQPLFRIGATRLAVQ
ncbi:MAG TPA: tyrosinase family protein [Steroidobacteraceae bacterium]|nr:tyrosinase family protein [Steroidobacteraceae bacterium]